MHSRIRMHLLLNNAVKICTFLIFAQISSSFAHEHEGCISHDGLIFSQEWNDLVSLMEKDNSPVQCEAICAARGFQYFRLSRSAECWCLRENFSKSLIAKRRNLYGNLLQESVVCNIQCPGDSNFKCGGKDSSSLYRITQTISKSFEFPVLPSGRPLLALVMIVKDEAHTISSTLKAVKPFIDRFYILDTGSTDGTQKVISEVLSPVPGNIFNGLFVDYGSARNEILDLVSKQNPTPEFTLMLSADEVLVNAHRLREYCKRLIDRPINVYEAHIISIKGEVDFQTHRLSRVDTKWRYVGRVHEVLVPPDYPKSPWRDIVIPDLYIAFRPTDVKRRKETQLRILKILEEDKQSNPDDHRTSFYLARTYADVGQSENAISEFKHRISLGGWFEEIYMSHMGIAREMRKMSYPWKEIQRVYLSAFSSNPDRAEPLFEISSFLNKQKEFSLACNFAKKAFSMKYPRKSSLFVDYQVYQWKAAFEYARCSWELGNFFEGSRAVVKAYQTPKPMQNKELKILYESFKAKMKELGKEFPPSEDINFHWISWVILLCIALLLLVSARFIIINERPSKSKKE